VIQTTQRRSSGEPGDSGDQVASVVRAALAVPGVSAVRIEPDADGVALLRLELDPGADEDAVARAVDERVQAAIPAQAASVEAPVEAAVEAPVAVAEPVPASAPVSSVPASSVPASSVPTQAPRPTGRGRSGRTSVPSVSSPTVASTPAPQWLDETAPSGARDADQRLVLERVSVVTERFSTTATVVLAQGASSHTGVADAAATASGAHRSLAMATVRALESAVAGRMRAEVDAVTVAPVGGEETAVVLLSLATERGQERLTGASLVERDPQRAVVKAVLAACNRRLALDLTDRSGR